MKSYEDTDETLTDSSEDWRLKITSEYIDCPL